MNVVSKHSPFSYTATGATPPPKEQLSHITSLVGQESRVRHSPNREVLQNKVTDLWQQIKVFFQDLFSSSRKTNDIADFNRYSSLLNHKITDLNAMKDKPVLRTHFFINLKELLHVQAKIQYTGWEASIKDNPQYREFSKGLAQLAQFAKKHVYEWEKNSNNQLTESERRGIRRWIEAGCEEDGRRLKYAGYSNEIALTAEEVPAGAVLLYNPNALKVRDIINGHRIGIGHTIKKIKTFFCNIFTGVPVTHAMASLGKGHFFHIDKVGEADGVQRGGCCSGVPMEEDFTVAKRGKVKYLFEYDIVFPNYEELGKKLNLDKEGVEELFKGEWTKTIKSTLGTPESPATPSSFWNIISTILNSKRPANYKPEEVFNPRPQSGYSCSGLVSSSLAKHGIDIVERQGKQVNKAAPADFLKTRYYTLEYSNDRPTFARFSKE